MNKGAVTCGLFGIRMAWYILIGNVSTGVITWSALWFGASSDSGKKVAVDPLSKTAAAAAVAKTRFVKFPLDYMLHNTSPWKPCVFRSSRL